MQRTKEYIWDEMTKCEKGQLSVDEVCSENKDKKLVMKSLNEMEEEGRIMMSNGKISSFKFVALIDHILILYNYLFYGLE